MLIKLSEEQRNNILGLVARAPKLPNESSFEFARIVAGIEQALVNPIKDTLDSQTLTQPIAEMVMPENGKP
jgi:hypothetical protein